MDKLNYAIFCGIINFAVLCVFIVSLRNKRDRVSMRISIILLIALLMGITYQTVLITNDKTLAVYAISICIALSDWLLLVCTGLTGVMLGGGYDRACNACRPLFFVLCGADSLYMVTNVYHNDAYHYIYLTDSKGNMLLSYIPQLGSVPHVVLMFTLAILTLSAIVLETRKSRGTFGAQFFMVFISIFSTLIANGLYQLSSDKGVDISVPLCGVSAMMYYTYLYVYNEPVVVLNIRKLMIDNMESAMIFFDEQHMLADFNHEATELLQVIDDYKGTLDEELFVEGRLGIEPEELVSGSTYEIIIPDGDRKRYYNVAYNYIIGATGKKKGSMFVFHDVTEIKELHSELEYRKLNDSMTGFASNQVYERELYLLDKKENYPLSVAVMNINGIDIINSILGRHVGDDMIKFCASVLKSQMRDDDKAIRLDGETIIIMTKTTDAQAVRLMKRVQHVIDVTGIFPMKCSVEFGVAEKNDENVDALELRTIARNSMYRKKMLNEQSTKNTTIKSLNRHLEDIGYNKPGQKERMVMRTAEMCRRMNLSDEMTAEAQLLAALHDIGMMCVSDSVIKKPGPLTDEEWAEVRLHPKKGYLIANIQPELSSVASCILAHHENWDGSGYPNGLAGEDIPIPSRIVSIVKAYDVMTQGTFYKDAISSDEALLEISRCAGTQFAPDVAEIFVKMIEEENGVFDPNSYRDYYINKRDGERMGGSEAEDAPFPDVEEKTDDGASDITQSAG